MVPLKRYENVPKTGRAWCSDTTTKTTATKKNRRRHNDDIYDEDVENQQPSPHPMPLIILPQVFIHAQNTFLKPVSLTGAMNNTSSTVLNFKNMVYIMRSCPKTQTLSLQVFAILFSYIVPKPKLYLYKFFYHYISVQCPKIQALSLQVFAIIFQYIVRKLKLYL